MNKLKVQPSAQCFTIAHKVYHQRKLFLFVQEPNQFGIAFTRSGSSIATLPGLLCTRSRASLVRERWVEGILQFRSAATGVSAHAIWGAGSRCQSSAYLPRLSFRLSEQAAIFMNERPSRGDLTTLDEADSVLKKGNTVKASLMVQEAQRFFLESDLGSRANPAVSELLRQPILAHRDALLLHVHAPLRKEENAERKPYVATVNLCTACLEGPGGCDSSLVLCASCFRLPSDPSPGRVSCPLSPSSTDDPCRFWTTCLCGNSPQGACPAPRPFRHRCFRGPVFRERRWQRRRRGQGQTPGR